jgi:hypothetical protein
MITCVWRVRRRFNFGVSTHSRSSHQLTHATRPPPAHHQLQLLHTHHTNSYASPIALRPQRKYALGLYVESQTYANIKETRRAVLQVG